MDGNAPRSLQSRILLRLWPQLCWQSTIAASRVSIRSFPDPLCSSSDNTLIFEIVMGFTTGFVSTFSPYNQHLLTSNNNTDWRHRPYIVPLLHLSKSARAQPSIPIKSPAPTIKSFAQHNRSTAKGAFTNRSSSGSWPRRSSQISLEHRAGSCCEEHPTL